MKTIYLDTCCIQRPYDNREQLRIKLEAEATLCILAVCDAGEAELISSEALLFEANQNPNEARKEHTTLLLSQCSKIIEITDAISHRAKNLVAEGFRSLDALHLASAEAAKVDYFCTCDDKLLQRAKKLKSLKLTIVSPMELAGELSK